MPRDPVPTSQLFFRLTPETDGWFIFFLMEGTASFDAGLIRDIYGPVAGPRIVSEISGLQARSYDLESHELAVTLLLPISHNGQRFNIPMAVLFPLGYPGVPPRASVKPRADMRVADRHPHVDARGLVYHPYLASWRPTHSVTELLAILSPVFGQHPPLYTVAMPPGSRPAPPSTSISSSMAQLGTASQSSAMSGGSAGGRGGSGGGVKTQVTEQLKERVTDLREIFSAELQEDMRIREALQEDHRRLTAAHSQLLEAGESLTVGMVLLGKALSTPRALQQQGHVPDLHVDQVVVADSPVNARLLSCVAGDSAYSDLIYQLDKALIQNVLPLDAWIRLVRQSARDQFFERALALKISRQRSQSP